jgi:hypothetical protein
MIAGGDDVQLTHGDVRDAASKGKDVHTEDTTLRAHLFREDIHRPDRIWRRGREGGEGRERGKIRLVSEIGITPLIYQLMGCKSWDVNSQTL